jgi:hypothetical protein
MEESKSEKILWRFLSYIFRIYFVKKDWGYRLPVQKTLGQLIIPVYLYSSIGLHMLAIFLRAITYTRYNLILVIDACFDWLIDLYIDLPLTLQWLSFKQY